MIFGVMMMPSMASSMAPMNPASANFQLHSQLPNVSQQSQGLAGSHHQVHNQFQAGQATAQAHNPFANYDPQLLLFALEKAKSEDGWDNVEPEQQHIALRNLQAQMRKSPCGSVSVQSQLEKIRSTSCRRRIKLLVENQNEELWRFNKSLKFSIAWISLEWRSINRRLQQLKRVQVMLETQPSGFQELPPAQTKSIPLTNGLDNESNESGIGRVSGSSQRQSVQHLANHGGYAMPSPPTAMIPPPPPPPPPPLLPPSAHPQMQIHVPMPMPSLGDTPVNRPASVLHPPPPPPAPPTLMNMDDPNLPPPSLPPLLPSQKIPSIRRDEKVVHIPVRAGVQSVPHHGHAPKVMPGVFPEHLQLSEKNQNPSPIEFVNLRSGRNLRSRQRTHHNDSSSNTESSEIESDLDGYGLDPCIQSEEESDHDPEDVDKGDQSRRSSHQQEPRRHGVEDSQHGMHSKRRRHVRTHDLSRSRSSSSSRSSCSNDKSRDMNNSHHNSHSHRRQNDRSSHERQDHLASTSRCSLSSLKRRSEELPSTPMAPIHIHMTTGAPSQMQTEEQNRRRTRNTPLSNIYEDSRQASKIFVSEPMSRESSWDRGSNTASGIASSANTGDGSIFDLDVRRSAFPQDHGFNKSHNHSNLQLRPRQPRLARICDGSEYNRSVIHHPPANDYPHQPKQRAPYYERSDFGDSPRPIIQRRNSIQVPSYTNHPMDMPHYVQQPLRSPIYAHEISQHGYGMSVPQMKAAQSAIATHDSLGLTDIAEALAQYAASKAGAPLRRRRMPMVDRGEWNASEQVEYDRPRFVGEYEYVE